MKKSITAHTVILNEERWIWYSLTAALPFVDQIFVVDLGSQDKTLEIISSIKSDKIKTLQMHITSPETESVAIRQQLLEQTRTDWFMILDGDEIWYQSSLQKVQSTLDQVDKSVQGIVSPTVNFLGDLYHVEEEKAGRYELLGHKGHFALRFIKKVPGLHLVGKYPLEGYLLSDGTPITNDKNLLFLDAPYCHMTNLQRSASRQLDKTVWKRAFKSEIGNPLSANFIYPEVFSSQRPEQIPSPWVKMSTTDKVISSLQTPFKRIKRRLI